MLQESVRWFCKMLRRDSGRILFEQSYSGTLFIIRGLLNYYLSFLLCLSIVSLHWSLLYHQSPPHRRHTVDWKWAKMIYLVWAFWGMSHLLLEAVQQALKSFQMSSADEALVFIAFISLLLSPFQNQKKNQAYGAVYWPHLLMRTHITTVQPCSTSPLWKCFH